MASALSVGQIRCRQKTSSIARWAATRRSNVRPGDELRISGAAAHCVPCHEWNDRCEDEEPFERLAHLGREYAVEVDVERKRVVGRDNRPSLADSRRRHLGRGIFGLDGNTDGEALS